MIDYNVGVAEVTIYQIKKIAAFESL